jgi:fermentation-respiration switch protein FrsA (DUF1100 family)
MPPGPRPGRSVAILLVVRVLFVLLSIGGGIYLLLALVLYLAQERMLFLPQVPGRAIEATPGLLGFEYSDVLLRTADNVSLHGWYVPAPERRGVLLFLHGNAGNISHRLDSIAIFRSLGLDTLIIDYRGYGRSEGKASERGVYLDAEAAWHHLVGERQEDPARIVIFGRSMGGAVAAWLSTRYRAAGVIIESCFTSAVDLAEQLYPFMPVRSLARIEFPAGEYVALSRNPVLVVHSRDDEIIPFTMGQALFAAAPEPRALLQISGDHNGGFLTDRDRYRSGLLGFIAEHLPESAP